MKYPDTEKVFQDVLNFVNDDDNDDATAISLSPEILAKVSRHFVYSTFHPSVKIFIKARNKPILIIPGTFQSDKQIALLMPVVNFPDISLPEQNNSENS